MATDKPVETFAQFCANNARKRRSRRIALALALPTIASLVWAFVAVTAAVRGAESVPIDEDEQRRVAAHEVGHVIVAVAVDPDLLLISTETRTRVGPDGVRGVTRWQPHLSADTAERMRASIAIACGGRAADVVLNGAATEGAVADMRDATLIAIRMRHRTGVAGLLAYKETLDARDWLGIEGELQAGCRRAERIVAANKDLATGLVDLLLAQPVEDDAKTLTGADVYMFMAENESMPIEPPLDECPAPPAP